MSKLNCQYIFSNYLSIGEFVLISFMLLIVFSLLYLKFIKSTRISNIGLVLLFIGATGNLLERFSFGCVLDRINFLNIFRFNIGDLMITVGVVLMGWGIWKKN